MKNKEIKEIRRYREKTIIINNNDCITELLVFLVGLLLTAAFLVLKYLIYLYLFQFDITVGHAVLSLKGGSQGFPPAHICIQWNLYNNKVLNITNDFHYPSNSKIYGKL